MARHKWERISENGTVADRCVKCAKRKRWCGPEGGRGVWQWSADDGATWRPGVVPQCNDGKGV